MKNALGKLPSIGSKGRLPLFAEDFDVGFAVGVEAVFFASGPGGFQVGGGDVPVGAALFQDRAQVLAQFFVGGTAEEPVAIIDLVDDEAGFQDDDVRDHRIVLGIGVLGDIEVFLHDAARVG